MLGFRSMVVLLAGFSLFSDEQERFICNTIQPGCSNVCFNIFAPVSILRLWLFHLIFLFLPHVTFATYVAHKVLSKSYFGPTLYGSDCIQRSSPLTLETPSSLSKTPLHNVLREGGAPRFYCAYVLVVMLRVFLEAAFGAGQFFLFGLSFPKSFLCYEAPCTSGVECYVSRPTEKSLMLNFMLGLATLSIFMSFLDLVSSIKAMVRWRRKREFINEEISKREQSSIFTATTGDTDALLTKRTSPSLSSKHANGGPTYSIENGGHPSKPELPCPSAPSQFVLHSQFKPPFYPRPNQGPLPVPRAPTPSTCRRQNGPAGSNSGHQSDRSDPRDKRAWV